MKRIEISGLPSSRIDYPLIIFVFELLPCKELSEVVMLVHRSWLQYLQSYPLMSYLSNVRKVHSIYHSIEYRVACKDYLKSNQFFSDRDMYILLTWLRKLANYYGLKPKTWCACVYNIHKYLSTHTISLASLQLVGCATLRRACVEENQVHVPSIGDIVTLSGGAFTTRELLNQEALLFDLSCCPVYTLVSIINDNVCIGEDAKKTLFKLLKTYSMCPDAYFSSPRGIVSSLISETVKIHPHVPCRNVLMEIIGTSPKIYQLK